MQLSARNVLKGKVVEIKRGAVVAQVRIELAGGNTIASVITLEALDALGLKEGDEASAVIKATDVMLAS